MSDATLYHEELLEQELQLENLITKANKLSSGTGALGELLDIQNKCTNLFRRLNKNYAQLCVEVRVMGDEADSAYYGELVKKHNTRIGELRGSMAKLKEKCETAQQDSFHPPTAQKESNDTTTTTNNNNNNNGEGRFSVWSPTEGGEEEAGADPSRVEARHAAGRINTIQHQTLQSLGNTETMLNETETVGQEAAVTLRKQTEQIEKTNEGLEEMHGEIGRAGKELKGFMRRMARDRIIIFFSIAIVVCLIVVVILAVLKHKWNK